LYFSLSAEICSTASASQRVHFARAQRILYNDRMLGTTFCLYVLPLFNLTS
jgi:hypothetical protein